MASVPFILLSFYQLRHLDESMNRARIELTSKLRIVDNPTFCWVEKTHKRQIKNSSYIYIFFLNCLVVATKFKKNIYVYNIIYSLSNLNHQNK
jgi:hypothetical protein